MVSASQKHYFHMALWNCKPFVRFCIKADYASQKYSFLIFFSVSINNSVMAAPIDNLDTVISRFSYVSVQIKPDFRWSTDNMAYNTKDTFDAILNTLPEGANPEFISLFFVGGCKTCSIQMLKSTGVLDIRLTDLRNRTETATSNIGFLIHW